MVMTSSLPAQRRILDREPMLMPRERFRSQRKCSKPSLRRERVTSDTWEESMACREMEVDAQSKLASLTKSLMESITFLRSPPCTSLASNIAGVWYRLVWV